jgi:hypothetical protein
MESTIIKGASSNQENDMEKVFNSKEMQALHTTTLQLIISSI